jgi:mannose-6-phosphate isomerase-like protein (cupin superfamily)
METIAQPFAHRREAEAPLWFLGVPTQVLATAEQTNGAFGLVEHVIPAGDESPWHVHHAEDEAFYLVEGEMTFLCGDRSVRAGPGSFVYGPRGVPHGFRVEGDQPARLLLLCAPGGFERFIIDLSEPAPPDGPPDMEHMIALAAQYNIDILGPLPE